MPVPGSTSTFKELAPEQMDCAEDNGWVRNTGDSLTVVAVDEVAAAAVQPFELV